MNLFTRTFSKIFKSSNQQELDKIKTKYSDLINENSGKVIKIEEWGLLNLAYKIKNYKKGFYIHFKFEGNNKTLNEIEKKIKENIVLENIKIIKIVCFMT